MYSNYLEKNQIKRIKLKLETKQRTSATVILSCLIGFSFLFPIGIFIVLFEEVTKSFFITVAIFWLVGFYFLRILLWNLYGVEEIELNKFHLRIYNSYRLFRLKHGVINTESLIVSFLPDEAGNKTAGNGKYVTLIFHSNDLTLKAQVPVSFEQALKVKEEILHYLNVEQSLQPAAT